MIFCAWRVCVCAVWQRVTAEWKSVLLMNSPCLSLHLSLPLPRRQRIEPLVATAPRSHPARENWREFKRKTEALHLHVCLCVCVCVFACPCVWLDCVSWEASETNLHSLFIVMLRLVTSLHWNQPSLLWCVRLRPRGSFCVVFSPGRKILSKANNFCQELLERRRKVLRRSSYFYFFSLAVSDYESWIYVTPPRPSFLLETVWFLSLRLTRRTSVAPTVIVQH